MYLLGSPWWIIAFRGPKSPKTPILGARISISSQICENSNSYIFSIQICISDWQSLTGSCGQQQRLRGWSRMVVKQFQDGGWPPFWKPKYRHFSVKNHRIFMKFCTQHQILNWMNVMWSKMKRLHWTDSEFDRTYFFLFLVWIFLKGVYPLKWFLQTLAWGRQSQVRTLTPNFTIVTFKSALTAPKIAKIGNFWYNFGQKGPLQRLFFIQHLAWGRSPRSVSSCQISPLWL